jgi:hypothetical protein
MGRPDEPCQSDGEYQEILQPDRNRPVTRGDPRAELGRKKHAENDEINGDSCLKKGNGENPDSSHEPERD